jgi:hypothetical protein
MTNPTDHQTVVPRRGDVFEQWLKTQRDSYDSNGANDREMYETIDGLLALYRQQADTGTPLGEHVREGHVVREEA